MTISKERVEELRNKLLLKLQADLEEIIHTTIEEAGKDPEGFLFDYIKKLKNDDRESIGKSSVEGYVYVEFPLSMFDFTKEELEYLGFYEDKIK